MLVLLGLVVGCSSSCSRAGEGSRAHAVSLGGNGPDTAAEGQTESRSMRVGNQVGGLAEMPDYDGEAVEVRAAVVDRLPDPLPDAATACAQMLAAVRTYYLEGEGATSGAVSVLDATRDAGNHAAMLFDTAGGPAPVVLAEHAVSIPITGFGSAGDSTGSVDETAADTALSEDSTGGTGGTETSQADEGNSGGCGCSIPSEHRKRGFLCLSALVMAARRRNAAGPRAQLTPRS